MPSYNQYNVLTCKEEKSNHKGSFPQSTAELFPSVPRVKEKMLICLLSHRFTMLELATAKNILSLIIPFHAQFQATSAAQKEREGQISSYSWFLRRGYPH